MATQIRQRMAHDDPGVRHDAPFLFIRIRTAEFVTLSLYRSLAVCVCFIAIARAMSCYPSQAFALCRNELSYPQTHIFLEHAVFPHSHFIVKRYENRTHQMKRTNNQVNVNFVRAAIN